MRPALPPAQQPLIQQVLEIGQGPGGLGGHAVAAKLRAGAGVAGHMLAEQSVDGSNVASTMALSVGVPGLQSCTETPSRAQARMKGAASPPVTAKSGAAIR